jgi:hypothetical protein
LRDLDVVGDHLAEVIGVGEQPRVAAFHHLAI